MRTSGIHKNHFRHVLLLLLLALSLTAGVGSGRFSRIAAAADDDILPEESAGETLIEEDIISDAPGEEAAGEPDVIRGEGIVSDLIFEEALHAPGETTTLTMLGRYEVASKDTILAELNRIRREAYTEGVKYYSGNTLVDLSTQTYVPLKWSAELERVTMQRAAEATVYRNHTRPDGKDTWSVYTDLSVSRTGMVGENLAWNSTGIMEGISQFYEEKELLAAEGTANGVVGHYTSIISPDYQYTALSAFNPGTGSWVCTAQAFAGSVAGGENQLDVSGVTSASITAQTDNIVQLSFTLPQQLGIGVAQPLEMQASFVDGMSVYYPNNPLHKNPTVFLGNVAWSVSDNSIATINGANLTMTDAGTVTVTGRVGTLSASADTSAVVPVESVTLDQSSTALTRGETLQLKATVSPSNASNREVTWQSSNTAVASVDSSGLVTATGVGTATITVTTKDGNKSASCTVTVTVPVTGVSLNRTTATLTRGQTLQLTSTVTPSDATNRAVTWKSSDPTVATVNTSGLVTTKTAGSATITVTTADGGKSDVCKLTVKPTADDLTRDFISRAYKEILGRNPDTAGMNYWLGELKAKRLGGGQMCAQFLASKEFRNKKYGSAKKVEICYRVFFNRDANADATGKKYWTGLLDNGVSESYIARGMAGSTEFKNICADYGITQGTIPLTENRDKNTKVTAFVARCYKESLGRNGEADGLNYWTGEILSKRITPARTAEGFVFSKEMNSKGYNNSQFVQMLYRLCMGRTYDRTGLNYWLGQMNKGMTRQQVFTSFVNSPEFRNIVKSYGL